MHRLVAMRTGAGRKVPILVTGDGAPAESAAIVRWADRDLPEQERLVWGADEAEITELEHGFDERLGIESRRWVYASVRKPRSRSGSAARRCRAGSAACPHSARRG